MPTIHGPVIITGKGSDGFIIYMFCSLFLIILLKKYEVVVRIPHHRFMSLLDKMSPDSPGVAYGPIVVWTDSHVTSHRDCGACQRATVNNRVAMATGESQ
jgi:hypothetical protein